MTKKLSAAELRHRAEAQLSKNAQHKVTDIESEVDRTRLIHELQVHQIELEMQNESLIEAQAQAEASLRLYTDLYDFAPVGYFTLLQSGIILHANLTAAHMLGIDRSRLVNSHLGPFVTETKRTVFNHFLDQVFQCRDRSMCMVAFESITQGLFWAHLEGVYDIEENSCRVIVIDITARVNMESQLRYRFEFESLIAQLSIQFDNSPVTNHVQTIENALVQVGRFIEMDHGALFLLTNDGKTLACKYQWREGGLQESEPLLTDVATNTIPDAMQKLRANELFVISDIMNIAPGSSKDYLRAIGARYCLAIPLYAQQSLLGTLMFTGAQKSLEFSSEELNMLKMVAEIIVSALLRWQAETHLKELNIHLEQRVAERTHELERASHAKDDFLATISHELRTPLVAIMGLSETLFDEILGPITFKQKQAIATVISSGQHLLRLINDILDLSKVVAGKMEVVNSRVDIQNICNNVIVFAKELASHKHIKVSMLIEFDAEWIVGDEQRLKQILINLLGNAVKFTPEGGEVGLEVFSDNEAHLIRFEVWDTGIGIATTDIPKLFQPFSQLNSTLSRQYLGTGLGLALVKQLTELQGGSVGVESQPGRGSRFTVKLPRGD